jgi:predicted nucleotidyltransferase
MNYKSILKQPEYDFLKTNKHLGSNIILLGLGGSHSYGTNIESSDLDIRGIALNSKKDILCKNSFKQFEDKQTDTVIYSFNKIISLLTACNPHVIELLGLKPEHYLYLSLAGKELLANKSMFLSQRAINSFGGYANQQLSRLENALARDRYTQSQKEEHIFRSCQNAMLDINTRYKNFDNGHIELYIDESEQQDLDTEIFINVSLEKYPVRDYVNILSELKEIIKTYNKINHRNRKKDDEHLNKHAMHLIRLYYMLFDILEKGEINTYREEEHDLLMYIRNGNYQKEDGTYDYTFFRMIDRLKQRLEYDKNNTSLPKEPDYKRIEDFVYSVNERIIKGEIQ